MCANLKGVAGIGTYDTSANENKGSVQFFPKTRARVGATLDQMFVRLLPPQLYTLRASR